MKKIYSVSEVSQMIDMHPNTIRLYESYGYISNVPRMKNTYRMYEVKHAEQLRLVQIAFSSRVINKRILDKIKEILVLCGQERYHQGIQECKVCKQYIEEEQQKIIDAVHKSHQLLTEVYNKEMMIMDGKQRERVLIKRKEAAKEVGVSMDVLRNWERNGLIPILKDDYGHNVYSAESILILKAIKLLRSVDFSIMSIINMRECYRGGDVQNLGHILDSTSSEEGEYFTDHLISLLENTKQTIPILIHQLQEIIKVSNSTPPEKLVLK